MQKGDAPSARIGNGTIFRLAPDGTFTTLHVFADDDTQANNPAEGKQPLSGLLQASDGNLYGVTSAGGYFGKGAVFSITTGGVFAKVGDLAPPSLTGANGENSAFGSTPMAALIQGSDGNLYGTTTRGGTEQDGVVYKVDLHPAAASTPPTVTATVEGIPLAYEGGAKAKLLLTRTGGDNFADLTVYFKLKGEGRNGVDYQLLPTSAIIPAAADSVKVEIKPIDDTLVNGNRAVTLKLIDSPNSSYLIGSPKKATITILDNDAAP